VIGSLPLGFAQPLVLLGLLSLPVLWWLLRLVPPRPRRINFPPTRLLFEIAPKEETPARTPWWLILLRLPFEYPVLFFRYFVLRRNFTGGWFGLRVAHEIAKARSRRLIKILNHRPA